MSFLWAIGSMATAILSGWYTYTGDYGFAVFFGLMSAHASIQAGRD